MENSDKVFLSKNTVQIPINDGYEIIFRKDKYNPLCVKKTMLENWEQCNPKVIDKLMQKGILVVGEDKEPDLPGEINKLRANYHDNVLEIRVVVSYLCDESCSYCLASDAMNRCKEIFLIDWIDNLFGVTDYFIELHNDINIISFTFIGGEPLLSVNWGVYTQLIDSYRKKYSDKSVITRVISNGNKLKDTNVNGYSAYIDEIYLSFDIRGQIEDLTQPIQRNSYQPFLDLLKLCLDQIGKVTLDFKINEYTIVSNKSPFLEKIKVLSDEYGERLVLAASPIVTFEEYDPYNRKHVGKYDLRELSERNSLVVLKNLKEYFGEFFTFWPRMQECAVYRCKTANNHTLMVYPNGKVSICGKLYANISENVPFIADLKVGSEVDENKLINEDAILLDEECMNCEYYFICGGKCPLVSNSPCGEEKQIAKLFIELAAEYDIEKRMKKKNDRSRC